MAIGTKIKEIFLTELFNKNTINSPINETRAEIKFHIKALNLENPP